MYHSDHCVYYGEGWYQYDVLDLVNFGRQIAADIWFPGGGRGIDTYLYGTFQDGTILAYNQSWKFPIIVDANIKSQGNVFLPYSDDLNHYDVVGENILYSSGTWSKQVHNRPLEYVTYNDFYGNKICEVTAYPELFKIYQGFYGDYAVIYIIGADDHYYVMVINKNGEMMFEPYELAIGDRSSFEYASSRVYGEYLIIQTSDEQYSLMNMNGELVHSISEDFPNCEIDSFGSYNEGFLVVNYSINEKDYRKYYPVAEAAAAGDAVYDLGDLGTATEDEENDNASGTGTKDYDYTFISGFSIEGKWKSVGDSGFGQAQPGAIVTFDGTNCNFFSSKDTYALYQDGDTYKLDVTSYLFADTLTFTVNTVDEDHIVITSGQTVTELERVG